tara:strand:- start:6562 stop:6999 length:438 start_codon:yes stop_codon:yes gene_type:complete
MKLFVSEIIDQLGTIDSFEKRVEHLKSNTSKCLRTILKYAFDSSLSPDVKELPEYKADDVPIDFAYNDLHSVYSRLYLFFDKSVSKDSKRNHLLLGILESLPKEEAEVFAGAATQSLKKKYLTEFLVRKAFPRLLSEEPNGKVSN